MSKQQTLEEMLSRLEKIVGLLSDEQRPLQEALELYAESAKLVAASHDIIEKAELRVTEYKKQIAENTGEADA